MERENIDSPWCLQLMDEEVVPNHSLAQLMSNNFSIRFPELPDAEDDDQEAENGGSSRWRYRYFAGIQNVIRHQERWEILDECVLGIFSFQKIAMWDDLGKNKDQITEHDLCRAVAGDQSIRVKAPDGLPRAEDLDKVSHPTTTYHILDSDSSQHEAIEAAKRGASLVLDGPPGTGKSQTIANIIAEFLAAGEIGAVREREIRSTGGGQAETGQAQAGGFLPGVPQPQVEQEASYRRIGSMPQPADADLSRPHGGLESALRDP